MKSRLSLHVLLVISLAFNVAVIAMQIWPGLEVWHDPQATRGADAFRDRITRDMDEPDAAIVRVVFERHHPEFLARRHDSDAAIETVRSALAADPFDPKALETAMDKARATRNDLQEVMEATLIDAAKQISPAGRKRLVPPANWDHHPPDGPPPPGPPPGEPPRE